MTDLDALLKAITENPAEDTPRLAYADALDDAGGGANEARAEFIRLSFELERIGPKPRVVSGPVVVLRDDLLEIGASAGDWFRVGERVDTDQFVHRYEGTLPDGRPDIRAGRVCGLRVEEVVPDEPSLGTVKLRLRRDEDSKPYPAERVKEVTDRCGELFAEYAPDWSRYPSIGGYQNPPHFPAYATATVGPTAKAETVDLVFRRGFAEFVRCRGETWARLGDELVAAFPLRGVRIQGGTVGIKSVAVSDLTGRYAAEIAGRVVVVPERAAKSTGGMGAVLSARWPSIPPENWVGPWTALSRLRGSFLPLPRA